MCLAVPGRILEVTDENTWSRRGNVDFGGLIKEINLALVPDSRVGDHVLVHVGVALHVIDEEEARRVLEYLEQIDELEDLAR